MSSSDEDISLYSRAFYRRYRERSLVMAEERSAELASSNDRDGVVIWRRVVQQIKQLAASEGRHPDGAEADGRWSIATVDPRIGYLPSCEDPDSTGPDGRP